MSRKFSPVGARWSRLRSIDDGWYDSNPFGTRYLLRGRWAIHTGADLNLPGNADKDMPVYAMQDGEVIFAARVPRSTWGNLLVIRHADKLHTRYAHLARLFVRKGDIVNGGQIVGAIGNSGMEYLPGNDHLHFDICTSGLLQITPLHWPGDDWRAVFANYTDPFCHIFTTVVITRARVTTGGKRLNVRTNPSLAAPVISQLEDGSVVEVYYTDGWSQLVKPAGWVATRFLTPLNQ